ncbi:serpin peptidase inhibitor, clade A (alpha-1 antiproteinase, antitrypsin), member 10a [Colossoma macropomum]|uniref:serpin peptidase inhibitor, clade A (alpha-1 antiproteinase, antitrypsin), member 10a n=1 Tax=Colossoma macropomum TaxID=42526 RepID=UPI001863C74A|nr:serpin peptidase inhibitor, clade A (alpha-1 antiproteinase, antitrypsin), member 10a [Colossoma macropomum]XP_036437848.1 serpin peptidase inhibitor, clade A (alpha-1 antiproteinase, antitrypsin), member 10a [Colossoma macropomum]
MEMGIFSVFIKILLLVASVHGQTANTDIQELAGRSAEFGTALYRKIASSSDDNVVISPLAATLGLVSLAAGAGGDTRTELLQRLGLAPMEKDGEPDRIPLLLQQLRETVSQTVATGLFTSQQVQTESSFSSQVKKFYGTDVQNVDFANAQAAKANINNFVTSATANKVREVVDTVDPQSQLMLISAAYFTGKWQLLFNASFTQEERFYVNKYHIVQVPMMFRSDKYYLAYDPSLKVGILKLPCMDGTAMLVLLPDEDVDYTFIDEAMTNEVFFRWVLKLKKTKLEVQLPKFSLEQTFSLKQSLPSLGITKIFESGADLSGISSSPGLKLSEVVHKVSVEIDEKGGSAAPVSDSPFMDSLPPRLTINRPFLFLIYHEATKTLLHMGRVVDPTKN